jgi:hypothetical protein
LSVAEALYYLVTTYNVLMISLGQYVNFRRINPLMTLLLLSRNRKTSWQKLLPYTYIYRVEDLVDVIDSLTILEVYSSANVANWMRIGAE